MDPILSHPIEFSVSWWLNAVNFLFLYKCLYISSSTAYLLVYRGKDKGKATFNVFIYHFVIDRLLQNMYISSTWRPLYLRYPARKEEWKKLKKVKDELLGRISFDKFFVFRGTFKRKEDQTKIENDDTREEAKR